MEKLLSHLEELTFKAEVKERIQVDSEGHIEIGAGRVSSSRLCQISASHLIRNKLLGKKAIVN